MRLEGWNHIPPSPAVPPQELGAVSAGWRIDPPGREPPGSTAWLTWDG